jgi:hypothetical protein
MIIYIILLFYFLLIFYLILSKNNDNFKNDFIINVKNIDTKVQIINKNDFNNYKEKLDNLYKKCVFSNGVHPDFNLNNSESLVFILQRSFKIDPAVKKENEIIGSLQIDDFDKLNKKFYVDSIGALEDKKGLYLTFLCGDDNYKGVTGPLFEAVEEYAKNNNYEYILLEAKKEWRKNHYKKFGYENIIDNNHPSMIKLIR